jgi:hypothetical protein
MEITCDRVMLGAGTILAKKAPGGRAASTFAFDEPRVRALLTTAYEKQVGPRVLAKIVRACELWNKGEKALAHIHLAHANLPVCGEDETLRLFAADELLESGITPEELLKAQGFDPAPLALNKYNPHQPRIPAGSGRESGRRTSDNPAGTQTPQTHPPAGSPPVQVAQDAKCSAFITENCKGVVLREFPSEYHDLSVDQVLKDAQAGVPAAKKAKKLLFDKRFRKSTGTGVTNVLRYF